PLRLSLLLSPPIVHRPLVQHDSVHLLYLLFPRNNFRAHPPCLHLQKYIDYMLLMYLRECEAKRENTSKTMLFSCIERPVREINCMGITVHQPDLIIICIRKESACEHFFTCIYKDLHG